MTPIQILCPDRNYLVIETGLTWLEPEAVYAGAALIKALDDQDDRMTWEDFLELGAVLQETDREPFLPDAVMTEKLYFEYVDYLRDEDREGSPDLPIHWLVKAHPEIDTPARLTFACSMAEFGQARLLKHSKLHTQH